MDARSYLCDTFIRLWDVREGEVVRELPLPELEKNKQAVDHLLFTPDSRTLLASTWGPATAVRQWKLTTGKEVGVWQNDPGLGPVLAVSRDGRRLATGTDDGVIRLWDLATGKEVMSRDAHRRGVIAVDFAADGKTVLTCGEDGTARVWEARTGKPVRRFAVPTERWNYDQASSPGRPEVSFAPKGRFLVVRSRDTWRVWETASSKQLTGVALEEVLPELSPDVRYALRAEIPPHGRVRHYLRDEATGKVKLEVKGGVHRFSPEGNLFVEVTPEDERFPRGRVAPGPFEGEGTSFKGEGTLTVWDFTTGKELFSWDLIERGVFEKGKGTPEKPAVNRVTAMAISPDAKRIAFDINHLLWGQTNESVVRKVVLCELRTGKVLHRLAAPPREWPWHLDFAPDGKSLACAGGTAVKLYHVQTAKLLHEYVGHRSGITALAFSPDSRLLATASSDSSVLIWDVDADRK
jgi:WD40 repeat protein